MNVDAFRHFYDYHFGGNRTMWDTHITALTQAEFTQAVAYSQGSVCKQVVHMMNVDDIWFADAAGIAPLDELAGAALEDRAAIRAQWDAVEARMRDHLGTLTDDMLTSKPFPPGEDENLGLWQVLLHVVNHGTDHRAQVLRALHDLGQDTKGQDYIFYVYDNS
jgi:uncharacterized damage-inducible protein DinB